MSEIRYDVRGVIEEMVAELTSEQLIEHLVDYVELAGFDARKDLFLYADGLGIELSDEIIEMIDPFDEDFEEEEPEFLEPSEGYEDYDWRPPRR